MSKLHQAIEYVDRQLTELSKKKFHGSVTFEITMQAGEVGQFYQEFRRRIPLEMNGNGRFNSSVPVSDGG